MMPILPQNIKIYLFGKIKYVYYAESFGRLTFPEIGLTFTEIG